jgi:twinkle protein
VDELFTVKPGLMYCISGLPSSGKSEFCDQLMVNLSQQQSWKWAICSFENPPATHIAKLLEKLCAKPFHDNGPTPRIRQDEVQEALTFVNDHFVFLESKNGDMPTIDQILDRCKQAVMRLGVRGLVIDPYNYIRVDAENEHRAITDMLTKVVLFAQAHEVAVFFVAHPQKIYPKEDGTYPVVTGMHVSGSSSWFSKSDVGVTVHRGKSSVEIHCWKCRFKWIGQQGVAHLSYEVPTGRYFPCTPQEPGDRYKRSGWGKKEDYSNFDPDNLEF